jgi:Asp-tRNA(Asn)/Glu-tRNA(Gln) amidotransferase A subunit family amidase
MVLAWSQDRVGPICRTIEDCAMVFHAIHGVDEKDPGTVTTPFQFERRINLSSVRIGVVDNAPPELVNKLRDLGARPVPLGARPSTVGGGFGAESAAAFDSYVQMKARELGIDMATIDAGSGGGGGRGAGAAGAGAGGAGAGGAGAGGAPGAAADSSAGRGRGAGGAPAGAAALNRWTNGRPGRAFDFINNQRRRHTLISQMQELLKDLDMYIPTASGDIGLHAQTGHPTAVVQYMFEAPAAGRGGGAGRGGAAGDTTAGRAAAEPPPQDPPVPQPVCAQKAGKLYNDDKILSVAQVFQTSTDFHTRRPKIG